MSRSRNLANLSSTRYWAVGEIRGGNGAHRSHLVSRLATTERPSYPSGYVVTPMTVSGDVTRELTFYIIVSLFYRRFRECRRVKEDR